jgi:hypothetical protein
MGTGETIPNDHEKIPYHMAFYVKYELINTAKLVGGGNLAVRKEKKFILELLGWITYLDFS